MAARVDAGVGAGQAEGDSPMDTMDKGVSHGVSRSSTNANHGWCRNASSSTGEPHNFFKQRVQLGDKLVVGALSSPLSSNSSQNPTWN